MFAQNNMKIKEKEKDGEKIKKLIIVIRNKITSNKLSYKPCVRGYDTKVTYREKIDVKASISMRRKVFSFTHTYTCSAFFF